MEPITGILIDTETNFYNQMISLHVFFQTIIKTAAATLNSNYNVCGFLCGQKNLFIQNCLRLVKHISKSLLRWKFDKNTPRIL